MCLHFRVNRGIILLWVVTLREGSTSRLSIDHFTALKYFVEVIPLVNVNAVTFLMYVHSSEEFMWFPEISIFPFFHESGLDLFDQVL